MTSEILQKVRVAGVTAETFAALSVVAGKREQIPGGIKQRVGGSEPILKRIDPG